MNQRTATGTAPGAALAAELRDTVAADPTAPLTAAVQGPGGYGKTTLLTELAGIYRVAGVAVGDGSTVPEPDRARETAVLVDDAHRLDDGTLLALRELAESPGARLVVAYRPWPRSAALAELVGVLGRDTPPVQLGGLAGAALAERARAALGSEPGPDALERLRGLTGGVPRFVERVLGEWDSQHDPHGADDGWPPVPASVLDRFQDDFDRLDETSRACLVALALGATAQPDLLAGLLELSPATAADGLAAVRAGGLLDAGDAVLPLARHAVYALTPAEHRLALLRRLVDNHLERAAPVLPLVRPLLDDGTVPGTDPTLATAFDRAGDEALPESPRTAVRLFDAAVSAGAAPSDVAARRAKAAAAAGDLDDALRTADRAIVDESAPDRELGVQVSATALACRGLLRRSAELCRWSAGNARWPGDVAYAVVGLVATGSRNEAETLLRESGEAGPPTSLSGATTQLAEGMCESLGSVPSAAVSTLVRAASLAGPLGDTMLVPDTPAAVAAFVALHAGEFDVAESVIERAIESGSGGALLRTRHQLLAAWAPLLRGDTVTARARLDFALDGAGELAMRDRLTAVAIEAGIAGRDNDVGTLTELRGRARQAVAEHPADLFTLLSLGELVLASARLRDQSWLTASLREAWAVLSDLGSPPLWSALLHWKCVQAAIVLENPEEAAQHAQALDDMAGHTPLAAPLAGGAATWVRLQRGEVDRTEAERAARALHAAGLAGDGASLAGQAAIRTSDRKAMLELLECARTLQGKGSRPQKIHTGGAGVADVLSDREREVAQLVLAGLTYKQVGKRLFISAKTVEHHIGRIKQRLGCSDREELLTRLRNLVD